MSLELIFKCCYILNSAVGDSKKGNPWVLGLEIKLARVDEA